MLVRKEAMTCTGTSFKLPLNLSSKNEYLLMVHFVNCSFINKNSNITNNTCWSSDSGIESFMRLVWLRFHRIIFCDLWVSGIPRGLGVIDYSTWDLKFSVSNHPIGHAIHFLFRHLMTRPCSSVPWCKRQLAGVRNRP